MSTWQMKINADKCSVLHLGFNNPGYTYGIDNEPIASNVTCKDLGIYMSSKNLSFSKHCSIISRQAHFRRYQFNLAFSCKDIGFQVFLFCTYIRPMLEYSSSVWSPFFLKDINKIESVQRKFTKHLPGLYNTPYLERLRTLGMETLEERRIRLDLILMYKIVRGLVDLDFQKLFSFNLNNTRGHRYKVNIPIGRLNCKKFSFVNRVARIWNALSDNVVGSNTLEKFKLALKDVDVRRFCKGCAHISV